MINRFIKWGLYISLFLISCQSATSDYNVFKYNLANHPTSLDPAFAKSSANIWVCDHIFNTLVSLDQDGSIVPEIAKSWELLEEGTKFRFYIDQDYHFQNHECFSDSKGRAVTAEDVKYSLSRLIDPKVNSPGAWIFKNRISTSNPFEVINDTIIEINLIKPFQPFISLLSMQYCSIVPEEVVDCLSSEFKNNPIGTGPFIFKKWIKNQNLFLTKNKDYLKSQNNLDGIKISFIKDRKIAFLEIMNGNIDYFSGIESSFINQMLESNGQIKKEHSAFVKLHKSAYLNTEYIGFNLSSFDEGHPIYNKDFRKALNLSIDKKQLVRLLRNGIGVPGINGFTPPRLYDNEKLLPQCNFDLSQAKTYLSKSEVDLTTLDKLTINTNPDYQDIMLFVAKQWEQLGLKVEVELLESSVLREGMRNGNIGIFRASWIGDYPDIENFMSLFYSKNGAPPNYTRFKNAEFDLLYEKVNVVSDQEERQNLFIQMEEIIIENTPVIPLFYDQSSNFYSTNITNPSNNLMNVPAVQDLIREN